MLVIEDAWSRSELPGPAVATIGNFDGIHRGQRLILERVTHRATETGVLSAVVTFQPHPLRVLRPSEAPAQLTTALQKRELLRRLGLGMMLVIRFTPEFSEISARHFVEEFLCKRLVAREVYVGSRFGFGKEREGNLELLQEMGTQLGFRAEGVPELVHGEDPVSSTRIRRLIRQGGVHEANQMLGRPYTLTGLVVRGDGRGKVLGWPTVNIETSNEVLPADGVYASQIWLPSSRRLLRGVTNVGRRPTFPDGEDRVVESHLFDFVGDLYGEGVELSFLEHLRGERAFPSVRELTHQIELDAQAAREYLARKDCLDLIPTVLE
jgi:riboflavin kinase/FMN adenylyltransferase